jgi:hypothetical protein
MGIRVSPHIMVPGDWGSGSLKGRKGAGFPRPGVSEPAPTMARFAGKCPRCTLQRPAPREMVTPAVQPARHLIQTCIWELVSG